MSTPEIQNYTFPVLYGKYDYYADEEFTPQSVSTILKNNFQNIYVLIKILCEENLKIQLQMLGTSVDETTKENILKISRSEIYNRIIISFLLYQTTELNNDLKPASFLEYLHGFLNTRNFLKMFSNIEKESIRKIIKKLTSNRVGGTRRRHKRKAGKTLKRRHR